MGIPAAFIRAIDSKSTDSASDTSPELRRLIKIVKAPVSRPDEIAKIIIEEMTIGKLAPDSLRLLEFFLRSAPDAGKRSATIFAISDAAAAFSFPPGHPYIGQWYLQHPLDPNRYVQFDRYVRDIYTEKVDEFLRILGELSVRRIRGTCLRGVDVFGSLKGEVKVEGRPVVGSVGGSSREGRGIQIDEHYNPSHAPRNPAGPEFRWLRHEPSWAGLIDRRLNHGLQKTYLRFEHKAMAGLGVDVAAAVAEESMRAGIDARYLDNTVWEFELDFERSDVERKFHLNFQWLKRFFQS